MAKRKRKDSLEAMVALDHAYGQNLTRKRQFQLGAIPAVYITAYITALTLDWKIGLVAFIASLAGCYVWLLPKAVRAEYDAKGLNQRNLLINQLSQSVVDTSKPYQFRLQSARDSIEGSVDPADDNFNQLKSDMDILITKVIQNDSQKSVHDAFDVFMTRYEDDAIFSLFFEQIETLAQSGFLDLEIIGSLRDQHNDLYREYLNYVSIIKQKRTEFFVMSTYTFGVVMLLMTSLIPVAGKAQMDKIFMHGYFGFGVIGVFILCFIGLLKMFYGRFFDRSLTTFGKASRAKKKPQRRMTEAQREREIRKFTEKKVNRWLYSTITENEARLMRDQQLTIVDMIKFQYNRFITMFVVGLVVGATATAFTKPLYCVLAGIVSAIGFYIYKAVDLRRGLADFKLARSMAFAKFTRLLIPYLKAPNNRNSYNMFEFVSRRLDDEGDRQMVYGLMNGIRDDPDSAEPYTDFAKRFTGDQRSIAYMQAIYGVLNTRGGKDIIDSLAKQANQEFMAKVHEVVYKKLGKYNFFVGANILIAMIPIFGLIAAFVFQSIMGAGMSF